MHYIKFVLKSTLSCFHSPIFSGILAFCIYAIFAAQRGSIISTSSAPYFNYLADAFLHGQLSLRLIPANLHDLAFYNGQTYMYWPPFPAVLLMPFVAIFGVGFSDVLFTIAIGALNITLVAYTLRLLDTLDIIPIDADRRGILTIFFAFGTVHLLLSSLGGVHFTSQIIAFLCSILVFLAAVRYKGYQAFFGFGLALACAALTRNHLILLGIWPAYYLFQSHKHEGWVRLLSYFCAAALCIFTGLILNGLYNQVRFGDIFEAGVAYQQLGSFFQANYQKYGLLNIHYFRTDFYYTFLFYPFPLREETFMGGSLFLLSPLFFAAIWAVISSSNRRLSVILWLTVAAVSLPILIAIGTGFSTFGPRYTLDFTMPLLLLTAIGAEKWPNWLIVILTMISVAHYYIGTLFFVISN